MSDKQSLLGNASTANAGQTASSGKTDSQESERVKQADSLMGTAERPASHQGTAETPGSHQGTAEMPASHQGTAEMPASHQGTAETPRSHQGTAEMPASHQGTAERPASHQGTAERPGSHQGTAETPASHQGTAERPASHQGTAERPASHQGTAERPASHQGTAEMPASHQGTAEMPASHQGTAEMPASHQGAAERPASHQGTAERPASHQGTAERPASHQGAAETPGSHQGTAETPGSHQGTAEMPASHQGTAEMPASHQGAAERPGSHQGTAERSASHHGTAGIPGSHQGSAERPASHQGTAERPASHQGTAERPGSHQGTAERPGSHQGTAERSSSHQGTAERPASHQRTAERPGSHQGTAERPASHQGTAERPASHQGTAETPGSHQGTAERSSSHQGTAEMPASHQGTAERPASHQGTAERPASHQGTAERPGSHQGTAERPASHQGTAERPGSHQGTAERPASHQGTAEMPGSHQGTAERPASHQGTAEMPASHQGTAVSDTSTTTTSQPQIKAAPTDPLRQKDTNSPSSSSTNGAVNTKSEDNQIPEFLKCGSPGVLMKSVVLTKAGKSWDREVLAQKIELNPKAFGDQVKNCYPNFTLQHLIDEFQAGKLFDDVSALHCQLSKQIFEDPVTSPSGFTYEKKNIEALLKKRDKKEQLKKLNERTDLKADQLYPNTSLKKACTIFKEETAANPVKELDPSTLIVYRSDSGADKKCTVCFHFFVDETKWEIDSFEMAKKVQLIFYMDPDTIAISPFQAERHSRKDSDLSLWTIRISLTPEIIGSSKNRIFYKYSFFKRDGRQYLEYLQHSSFQKDMYRCLGLPKNFFCDREYHVFDTVVCPPSIIPQAITNLKNVFVSSNHDAMMTTCIKFQLDNIINTPCPGSDENCPCETPSLNELFSLLAAFFEAHHQREVCDVLIFNRKSVRQEPHKSLLMDVSLWICEWCEETSRQCPGKLLVSTLSVLWFCGELSFKLSLKESPSSNWYSALKKLFKRLDLKVYEKEKKVENYSRVLQSIGKKCRASVTIKCLLDDESLLLDLGTWMKAYCWCSFISQEKRVLPFEILDVQESAWRFLPKVPSYLKKRFDKTDLSELFTSGLFEANPFLLPMCLSLLSKSDHHLFINRLPLEYALVWFIQGIKDYNADKILLTLEKLQGRVEKSAPGSTAPLLSHALSLYKAILEKGNKRFYFFSEDVIVKLNHLIVSLIELTESTSSDDCSAFQAHITSYVTSYSEFGKIFGGAKKEYIPEMRMWIKFSFFGFKTERVRTLYMKQILTPVLTARITKCTEKERLDIFFQCGSEPSDIADIIEFEASRVLNQQILQNPQRVLDFLEKNVIDKKYLMIVVSKALESQVKKKNGHPLNMKMVMEWPLWPFIIRNTQAWTATMTSESEKEVLREATDCVVEFCGSINSRSIKLKEFPHDLSVVQSFKQLVDASTKIEKISQIFWEDFLELIKAIKGYKTRRKLLKHFCTYLDQFDERTLPGIEMMRDNLKEGAHFDLPLSQVCEECDGDFQYPALIVSELELPTSVLVSFKNLATSNKNDFFESTWKKYLPHADRGQVLPFSSIAEQVWSPAFEECKSLLLKVKDCSITIVEVTKLVEKREIKTLEKQLRLLYEGYRAEKVFDDFPKRLIDTFIAKVKSYREISKYGTAAKGLLELKTKLELTGDFTGATKIEQVGLVSGAPLCNIDVSVVDTAHVLKDCVSTPERMKCLNTMAKCYGILVWIGRNMKDLSDLQGFVTLAMETGACGEDALSMERMSNLRAVGSDFAPVIFDLPIDCDFSSLIKRFTQIWTVLDTNPKLIDMLVGCNEDIAWFKDVKNTQGDVEKSSYRQLENIMRYGIFKVGTGPVEDSLDKSYNFEEDIKSYSEISSLISLRLQDSEDSQHQFPKDQFSLSDLNDLESRLVLITGTDPQKREMVDYFLLVLEHVRRMAEALLDLQQSGCTKYLYWSLQFSCEKVFSKDRQSVFNVAHQIEQVLHSWRNYIESSRMDFFELNYFTTKQLLYLRYSLYQITSNYSLFIQESLPDQETLHDAIFEGCSKEHTLSLLRCLCNDITADTLLQVISGDDLSADCIERSSVSSEAHYEISTRDNSVCSEASGPGEDSEKNRLFYRLVDYYDFEEILAREAVKQFDNEDDAAYWCDENSDNPLYFSNQETREDKGPVEEYGNLSAGGIDVSSALNRSEFQKVGMIFTDQELQLDKTLYEVETDTDFENKAVAIEDLGKLLQSLAENTVSSAVRPIPVGHGIVSGAPNLIVKSEEVVLKTVLSLYMENQMLPLPSIEEVLICSANTTEEEVMLFLHRAVYESHQRKLYCLVHGERLSYLVTDKCITFLLEIIRERTDYQLVIVCSDSGEDSSNAPIFNRLHLYQRNYPEKSDSAIREYVKRKCCINPSPTDAASVDRDRSTVRIVQSQRAGMGKSLYIKRLSEKLVKASKLTDSNQLVAKVPILGPKVTNSSVLSLLDKHSKGSPAKIFHLDIDSTVLSDVVNPLFSLLLLQALSDSQGRIWRKHKSQLYCIEVTLDPRNAGQTRTLEALLSLFPTVECIGPREACLGNLKSTGSGVIAADDKELESFAYQRVYQYLKRNGKNLDDFKFNKSMEDEQEQWLSIILRYCGIQNPSWREVKNFVQFLNVQLSASELSPLMQKTLEGLKTFVVKFLITMSKDFATPSLRGELEGEIAESNADLSHLQIETKNKWEERHHPYIFFNQDRLSATFVGFYLDPETGNLYNEKGGELIEESIVEPDLADKLVKIGIQEESGNGNGNRDLTPFYLKRLCQFLGIPSVDSPNKSYVLTRDNFLKILGIQMRFRCGIPVILMGETGCGKTSLVRFMCMLCASSAPKEVRHEINNMLILKVHGGTTKKMISEKVRQAIECSKINSEYKLDTIIFFDEANTTDAIGLINEAVCDCTCQGEDIPRDIKFVAACNPYRRHEPEMIKKLASAGLGYYTEDAVEKIGTIPLRELVYRVRDLPQSMAPLVYDFGSLNPDTERQYTKEIVKNYVKGDKLVLAVTKVLTECQQYMRNTKSECSFVSLRDVERCMIVFQFFENKMAMFGPLPQNQKIDDISRSLIIALSVCYHARLSERTKFEELVHTWFIHPLRIPGGKKRFQEEIQWCQEVLLSSLTIPDNVAHNTALRENVFMMAVCVELRIPLFLVGKPGSSKSLAKTILSTSMQGQSSSSTLLQHFKQIQMFSYQCSKYSTPETVIGVFDTAKEFQEKQDVKRYVSVVVLDEVGLAEEAPSLPLKALHPLLEDGSTGGDGRDEVVEREQRVAFIGISNWALDPAKMNRGVMVTRGEPDWKELVETARGICNTKDKDDPDASRLVDYFPKLAQSYLEVCKKVNAKREFYGLRDFYSLIKMLYWISKESGEVNVCQLEYVVKRNFGGFKEVDAWQIFSDSFKELLTESKHAFAFEGSFDFSNPPCDPVGLIRSSLFLTSNGISDDRYLLFLTQNYTALQTLQDYLLTSSKSESSLEIKPKIMFGSSFPKDKEYTHTCRTINEIKLCMETGQMVVLLNLENLYESLYDVLNQYYLTHGGRRYVDLGLQSHRMKCQVHENFRLILIAEYSKVYDSFPTPLINRMEKHFVLSETLLNKWQICILRKLEAWTKCFAEAKNEQGACHFKVSDCFAGFQDDTLAAVVLCTTSSFGESCSSEKQASLLNQAKKLLLRMATPDSVIRLQYTGLPEEEQKMLYNCYFSEQCHSSLAALLLNCFQNEDDILNIQVTTHGPLLNSLEVDQVKEKLLENLNMDSLELFNYSIQEFGTEDDFSTSCSKAFDSENEALLVLQCESGHLNGDLIACVRHKLFHLRGKSSARVILIVHLSRFVKSSSFVGFQGDSWLCYHIDDLLDADDCGFQLALALEKNVSELFYDGSFIDDNGEPPPKVQQLSGGLQETTSPYGGQCQKLNPCVQRAVSSLPNTNSPEECIQLIELLLQLLSKDNLSQLPLSLSTFHGVMVKYIVNGLKQQEECDDAQRPSWYVEVAMNVDSLRRGATYRNALSLEIEDIIMPYFIESICQVNVDCNINILCNKSENKIINESVQKLWVDTCNYCLFSEECLSDSGSSATQVKINSSMPFFWVFFKLFEVGVQYESAEQMSAEEWITNVYIEIKQRLSTTPLACINDSLNPIFQKLYLHDLVRKVFPSLLKREEATTREYALIEDTLNSICLKLLDQVNGEGRELISYITMLHILCEKLGQHMSWFQETVSYAPAVVKIMNDDKDLTQKVSASAPEMVLQLHAMSHALHFILADFDKYVKEEPISIQKLQTWSFTVQELSLVCTSVLDSAKDSELALTMREEWMRIRLFQVLMENIVLAEVSLAGYARRLSLIFRRKKDPSEMFLKVLELMSKLVNDIRKRSSQSKSLADRLKLDKIATAGLTILSMEIISCIFFSYKSTSDDPLVKKLVDFVFSTWKVDSHTIHSVHIRLIQAIVNHRDKVPLLLIFFERLSKETDHFILHWQCALRCSESSFTLAASGELNQDVQRALSELHDTLETDPKRHSIILAVGLLRSYINRLVILLGRDQSDAWEVVWNAAERILDNRLAVNFTLRTIVRNLGANHLHDLKRPITCKLFGEISPPESKEENLIDPCVLYGEVYNNHRETLASALLSNNPEEVKLKECSRCDLVCWILTIKERLTSLLKQCEDPVLSKDKLLKHFVESNSFKESIQLKDLIRKIMNGCVATEETISDSVSPEESSSTSLVIFPFVLHTVAVTLISKKGHPVISFLRYLLELEKGCENNLLPTIPDEAAIKDVNEAQTLRCSNGHLFLKPLKEGTVKKCDKCGEIGTFNEQLGPTSSARGYILGHPKRCNSVPVPVRELSPASCLVIRAFIHALLFWNSYNDSKGQQTLFIQELLCLKSEKAENIAKIMWDYLAQDIRHLTSVLGLNIEEVCLILHIILHEMFVALDSSIVQHTTSTLDSPGARKKLEEMLDKFIQPITQFVDVKLNHAVLSNTRKSQNQLYMTIYGKAPTSEDELRNVLWSCSPQHSFDQMVEVASTVKKSFPKMLRFFFENEPVLRATQYLQDIVQLQKMLHTRFHHTKLESESQGTIDQFFDHLKEEDVMLMTRAKELFAGFQSAWNLVKETVFTYASSVLYASKDDIADTFNEETDLKFLIPTVTGPGVSSTALVMLLVAAHNIFIASCLSNTTQKHQETRHRRRKIQLSKLQKCHLLDYESELAPLLYCYLHTTSEGSMSFGNPEALEKHIIQKFVQGKPSIATDYFVVRFKQEGESMVAENINAVSKAIHQKELAPDVRVRIVRDLHNEQQHLIKAYSTIEIAMQFLKTGECNSHEMSVGEYVEQTLQMKMKHHRIISKALSRCSLSNIVSLWRTLGSTLAKNRVNDETPFSKLPTWLERGEFYPTDKKEFDRNLAAMDAEIFLLVLFDFIERGIRTFSEENKDDCLLQCLLTHIRCNNLRSPQSLSERFPNSIKVGKVIAVWKYVVNFQPN